MYHSSAAFDRHLDAAGRTLKRCLSKKKLRVQQQVQLAMKRKHVDIAMDPSVHAAVPSKQRTLAETFSVGPQDPLSGRANAAAEGANAIDAGKLPRTVPDFATRKIAGCEFS